MTATLENNRGELFPAIKRAVVYALLLFAFTAPISLDPGGRRFASGPDTRLYLWTLGWDLHALKTDPFHIFDANIFFPENQTLAYSEHLIGAALLGFPLSLFTSNLDLLLNFLLLAATFLTALGSDRLARECGYEGVCSAYGGYNFPGDDAFHLQRIHADDDMIRLKNWVTVDPRKLKKHRRFTYETAGQPVGAGAANS